MIVYQNNTDVANFSTTITWQGGNGALYAAGTWGSGTLTLSANDGSGSPRAAPVALGSATTLTANGWGGFWAPAGAVLTIALTGATNPALAVSIFTQG